MSRLEEIGARDGWRCWICDEPVDPEMSVNDPRGPSLDSLVSDAKSKAKAKATKAAGRRRGQGPSDERAGDGLGDERLAHRGCNTRKGAVPAVIPWPEHLFVVDPAPILGTVERLERKGGREVVARCPTEGDGRDVATWLTDRVGRLRPGAGFVADVEPGGGQFLVVLRA